MRQALASRLRSLIGHEVLEILCYGKAGLFYAMITRRLAVCSNFRKKLGERRIGP